MRPARNDATYDRPCGQALEDVGQKHVLARRRAGFVRREHHDLASGRDRSAILAVASFRVATKRYLIAGSGQRG
jgi:hypothetical protein